jgi:ribA/ribD-fused uncharacterized protein
VRPPDVEDLVHRQRAGERLEFLLFWGHRPARDNGVGAGCLSQWWPAPFTVDGVEYPTAEHFMMAYKALLFGDEAMAARIMAAEQPGQAKFWGRQVSGFDEAVWVEHRYDIVVRGNTAKFTAHSELAEYLLATGDRVLVEASRVDRVWGIGLAPEDERARHPAQWLGENLLGFALMEVRSVLAAPSGTW